MRRHESPSSALMPELAGLRAERDARPDRACRAPSPRAGRRGRRPPAAARDRRALHVSPRSASATRRRAHRARYRPSSGWRERDDPERLRVARMGHAARSRTGWTGRCGDVGPGQAAVASSGTRRSGSAGRASRARRPPSRACGRTGRSPGSGSGSKSARTPLFRGSHVAPPSRRLEHPDRRDPDPHPLRVGRVGDDRVAGSARRRPGPQVWRVGWFVSPSTCDQVAPPSSLRNRPAGSTPAKIDPSGPVARLQTVVIGSRPVLAVGHPLRRVGPRLPPSSLRHTAGPYQGEPPAARIAPVAGSMRGRGSASPRTAARAPTSRGGPRRCRG